MSRRPLLRPLLAWLVGAPALAASTTFCFILAPFIGGARAFWLVAPRYIRGMAWAFGLRRSLEGWESLPEDIREGRRAVVFLANHASLLDGPLIICTLPGRPVFIVKREAARVPFLGWVIWLAGFIFVDRSSRTEGARSLERAAARIRAGQSIAAFPEGTRTRDGRLLPFKRGAFNVACKAGVPVVPLAIRGGFEAMPPDTLRTAPGPYRLLVGAPLDPADFEGPEALRQASEAALAQLLAQGQEALQGLPEGCLA